LETIRAENITAGNFRKRFQFMRRTTTIATVVMTWWSKRDTLALVKMRKTWRTIQFGERRFTFEH
jgi:hypothetical protein